MKKIYTKVTAIALTAVMAFTAFQIGGIPTEAGNIPDADLGEWDYGFEADLFGASVNYLDEAFDVYQYAWTTDPNATGCKVGPVKPSAVDPNSWSAEGQAKYHTYFTTQYYGGASRGGLKPTSIPGGDNNGFTTLTYNKGTMKNFEAEYEFYAEAAVMGLTFGGEAGKFQITQDENNSNDTAVALYMEKDGKLFVYGAIDTDNVTTSGDVSVTKNVLWHGWMKNAANVMASGMTGADTISVENDLTNNSKTFTVCIKVQDGELSIHEKNHSDNVLNIKLSEQYQSGPVSLVHTNTQQGAFKSFRIKKNTVKDHRTYDLVNSSFSVLEAAFTSYQIDKETGKVTSGRMEDQWLWWFSYNDCGKYEYDGRYYDAYVNLMRPAHKTTSSYAGPKKYTLCTIKNTMVRDVSAAAKYAINYTSYGMMIAPEGELADPTNGIWVYVDADGAINLSGAIDGTTAKFNGTSLTEGVSAHAVKGPKQDGYVKPILAWNVESNNTKYTLNMKVEGPLVRVSIDEFPNSELTVELTSNYKGGAFSLFSTGYDQGGFVSLDVDLPEYDPQMKEVAATTKWEQSGDYLALTFEAKEGLYGTIEFPAEKYEFVSEKLPAENTLTNNLCFTSNQRVTAKDGKVTFRVAHETGDVLATYFFRPTSDTWNVNDFTVSCNMAVAESNVIVRGDVTNDGTLNVKDIVRLKRYAENPEVGLNKDNALLVTDPEQVTAETNQVALKHAILGEGTVNTALAGKKALFLGDSIGYGANDASTGFGWSGRMGALYGMNYRNVAVSGWMLADHQVNGNYQNGQRPIAGQLDGVTAEEGASYDYVILQGGVNDVWHSKENPSCAIPIGTVTSGQTKDFDTTTVCGALEDLIVKARAKAPNAKIGYIINFDISATIGDMNAYVSAAKEVCDKWNVPYLDLYNNAALQEMNFGNVESGYVTDGVHPNSTGYDILARYIGPWMEELK